MRQDLQDLGHTSAPGRPGAEVRGWVLRQPLGQGQGQQPQTGAASRPGGLQTASTHSRQAGTCRCTQRNAVVVQYSGRAVTMQFIQLANVYGAGLEPLCLTCTCYALESHDSMLRSHQLASTGAVPAATTYCGAAATNCGCAAT